MRDMYSKVKCRVKGCNSYSDFFECAIGLKQGEVMSPLLFALFVEDLELFLQNYSASGLSIKDITLILMLFADDIAVFGKTPHELQTNLVKLKMYCDRWGLEVNTAKTKVMVFRKRGGLKDGETWTYGNDRLEVVNDFNYLGTVFNYTGSYVLNQEYLSGKGLKALNVLSSNTHSHTITPKVLCQVFDAFVGATLSYACEIWGFTKSREIERIHLKFCKSLLGVKTSTCNMGVYGELGRVPLYISRYVRIIKYWCKIVQSGNIIIQRLYETMLDHDNNAIVKTWAHNVKTLLDINGFAYVWCNPHSVNMSTFHLLFKQRLVDAFIQDWNSKICNASSLTYYRHYKPVFELEMYLNKLPRKCRTALCRLRLASHKLRIVTGRYAQSQTARNLRVCEMCDTGDIEDEYHFVIVCPAYNSLRVKYLKPFYYRHRSVHKFIELMQSVNVTMLTKLSKFVQEAFAARQCAL
jgi:hypothetical protein